MYDLSIFIVSPSARRIAPAQKRTVVGRPHFVLFSWLIALSATSKPFVKITGTSNPASTKFSIIDRISFTSSDAKTNHPSSVVILRSIPIVLPISTKAVLAPNATIIISQYPSFLSTPFQPALELSLWAILLFIQPVSQSATFSPRKSANRIQCGPSRYDSTATTLPTTAL